MRLAWVLLAACGGGGIDGGGGGGIDGGAGSDGGGGTDSSDPTVDASPTPTHAGSITVQGFASSNANGGSAFAGFVTSGGSGDCPVTTVGACDVTITDACASATPHLASAGRIDVTGATVPISLVPGSDGTYPPQSNYMAAAPWLAGGETLNATAAGETVPAFHATVTAPSRATITSPAMPAAGSLLALPRTSGFTVAWSGGGGGKLQIYLLSGSVNLTCRFDASAHSATIPASTIAMLPAGMGSFAMATVSTSEVDAGDWAVTLFGYYNAVWQSGGAIVSGGATIQ